MEWMDKEPNTPSKLQEVIELIKYYGVPFLFECRILYENLSKEDRQTLEREMQEIMMLTKQLLNNEVPEDLKILVTNIPASKKKIEVF